MTNHLPPSGEKEWEPLKELRAAVERNVGLAMISTNSPTGVEALAKEARIRLDNLEQDLARKIAEERLEEATKNYHHPGCATKRNSSWDAECDCYRGIRIAELKRAIADLEKQVHPGEQKGKLR